MYNRIYEFFSSRDPDAQFLLISIEGLCSNLVALFIYMLINSGSINLIFVTTAAIATISTFKITSWNEKFKVMLFLVVSIGGLQFGLSIFIFNKALILLFLFIYVLLIFSIPNYQIYAAMSLFPAVTIIGSSSFTYQDAINRCFYQLIALLIAFSLALLFSLLSSKYMMRKAVTSYLYFLIKRIKSLEKTSSSLSGYSKESMTLQKIGGACVFQCIKKEYLLLKYKNMALQTREITISLFAIARGLLLLKNLNLNDPDVRDTLQFIENNLQNTLVSLQKCKKICIEDFSLSLKEKKSCHYAVHNKNNYVLKNILFEIKKLDGIIL